jgi:hypothetical protein
VITRALSRCHAVGMASDMIFACATFDELAIKEDERALFFDV